MINIFHLVKNSPRLLMTLIIVFVFIGCSSNIDRNMIQPTLSSNEDETNILPSETVSPEPSPPVNPNQKYIDILTQIPIMRALTPTIAIPQETQTSTPKTPSPEQKKLFLELLGSKTCKLPCYLGVIPGITTLSEAQSTMEKIGAVLYSVDKKQDGVFDELHFSFLLEADEGYIEHIISFTVENEIIRRTWANLITMNAKVDHESFEKYSVRNALLTLGEPDEVFLPTDIGVSMIYKQQKLVLEWKGRIDVPKDGVICPTFTMNNIIGWNFTITDPSSSLGYFRKRANQYDRVVWRPIEETSGMTVKQFYDLQISDPDICIPDNFKYPFP